MGAIQDTFTRFRGLFLPNHPPPYFVITHLHSTVEETAVLAWLIKKTFGQGERDHAAWLVGLA